MRSKIDPYVDKESKGFSLYVGTVFKASAPDVEDYFSLRSSFRADYLIEGYSFDPKEWQELPRVLVHQIYPTIRTHLLNMMGMTGLFFVQLPWSVEPASAKKTVQKTGARKKLISIHYCPSATIRARFGPSDPGFAFSRDVAAPPRNTTLSLRLPSPLDWGISRI